MPTAASQRSTEKQSALDKFAWSANLDDSTSSNETIPAHEDAFEKEWNVYINELKSTSETNSVKFWLDNCKIMPTLSELALSIFTVPSSSSAVERLFSHVTLNTTSRKANSKLDLVNQNVFMTFNKRFLKL